MKFKILPLILLLNSLLFFNSAYSELSVCFTPGQNCTQKIVNEIDGADKTILIQAYQFTSAPIADAVIQAKKRGVSVKIILDKTQYSNKRYSSAKFFLHNDIPVLIDYKVAIAHNKVMVIDGREVITGSFNFTKAAQSRNAENLLIIKDYELSKKYSENFQKRLKVSKSMNKLNN